MYNNVGQDYFETLQGALNGNIGFTLGLVLVVLGIYTMVVKKEMGAGLFMILGGALITLAPGVFNASRNLVAEVVQSVGGNDTTSGFQTQPGI